MTRPSDLTPAPSPDGSRPAGSMAAGGAEARVRLYEVTVRMWGESYTRPVSAKSPAAAKYRCFLDADISMPFRDYQRACSVRLAQGQPADDGYGYIRRAYGVDPRIGQRVTLINEGKDYEGHGGEVVYPGTSRQYVHVLLDGQDNPVVVHPRSIVFPPAHTTRPDPIHYPQSKDGGGR